MICLVQKAADLLLPCSKPLPYDPTIVLFLKSDWQTFRVCQEFFLIRLRMKSLRSIRQLAAKATDYQGFGEGDRKDLLSERICNDGN